MSFAAPNDEKRQQAYVSCSILSGWMSFAATQKSHNIPKNITCSILSGWMSFAALLAALCNRRICLLQYPQRMDELCSEQFLASPRKTGPNLQYPQRMDELCSDRLQLNKG